jgi:alcohol dehydrogenase, propanol-preferring
MKAWQYVGDGLAIALNEVPEPELQPGDVLLEVKGSGICHSDIGFLDGTISSLLGHTPITLGHESAGLVIEVGELVSDFAVGDRVAVRSSLEGPGCGRDGGFQPRVAVPSQLLAKIPDGVSWDQAAVSTDAGITAFRALIERGQAVTGEKIGIVGMGGLGSLAVQMGHGIGAEVYVAETNLALHEYARELGVAGVSNDLMEFKDVGLNLVCDFAGFGTTTAAAIDVVEEYGRVVLVGLGQNFGTLNLFNLTVKQVSLIGSLGGSVEDNVKVLDMMARGILTSRTEVVGFDDVAVAIEKLRRGEAVRRLAVVY